MYYGLHGTSLKAAESILKQGFRPEIAQILGEPRWCVKSKYVHAFWEKDVDMLIERWLWGAQGYAAAAAERHYAVPPRKGAVLLLEADDRELERSIEMGAPDPVAHYSRCRPLRIVAVAEEKPHDHPWGMEPDFCLRCYSEPELLWQMV